jgi:hypothetical protein
MIEKIAGDSECSFIYSKLLIAQRGSSAGRSNRGPQSLLDRSPEPPALPV